MLTIHHLLRGLAAKRPVFHNEADFQFALAWHIRERIQETVRLEWKPFLPGNMYVDLWVPALGVAIELKYRTRELEHETPMSHRDLPGERFSLRDQSAQDQGRYDFVKDVARLEQVLRCRSDAHHGIAVLLTNDPSYWKVCSGAATIDQDFRLDEKATEGEGRRLSGTMAWSEDASETTKEGREDEIALNGSYDLEWRDYSTVAKPEMAKYGALRYLTVEVTSGSALTLLDLGTEALRDACLSPDISRVRAVTGKYQPLYEHLVSLSANEWRTTFAEVESILGNSLPDAARTHRPWWANDRSPSRSQAKAWLEAGWETRNVSMSCETVEFHRVDAAAS